MQVGGLGAAQVLEVLLHAVADAFVDVPSCSCGDRTQFVVGGGRRDRRQARVALRRASRRNAPPRATCAPQSSMRVHRGAKGLAAGQRAHRPADVLARAAHAGEFAVQRVVVRAGVRAASAARRAVAGGAGTVPVARKCAISRKIQGRPCAARPIISASAPVAASTARALAGESMSPLATTGIAQRRLHGGDGVVLGLAVVALLARAAVHGDHRDAGALGRARQRAPRCARPSHQPVRIFSVTGTPRGAQAATTASTIAQRQRLVAASAPSRPSTLHTFLAGQPMLMSMICAPRSML